MTRYAGAMLIETKQPEVSRRYQNHQAGQDEDEPDDTPAWAT